MNYGDTYMYDGVSLVDITNPNNTVATNEFIVNGNTTINNAVSTSSWVSTFQGTIQQSHLTDCTGDNFTTTHLNVQNATIDSVAIQGGSINYTHLNSPKILSADMEHSRIRTSGIENSTIENSTLKGITIIDESSSIMIGELYMPASELKELLNFVRKLHKDLQPKRKSNE